MKFILDEVVFVKNHPEIDINTEAVGILNINRKNKTYTVYKTADTTQPHKLFVVKESDIISPLEWIDLHQKLDE
ncbi:hypothetical protein GALL_103300 [mine drainage metagenome]|uniref:Uncharacterized protein n=1 Tax=mine drainage metagenome TaxID=410659 RepID=A0A1J5SGU7_9ZZZZ